MYFYLPVTYLQLLLVDCLNFRFSIAPGRTTFLNLVFLAQSGIIHLLYLFEPVVVRVCVYAHIRCITGKKRDFHHSEFIQLETLK